MRVKREEQLIQKDTPPKMRRFPAVLHMNVRTKLTSVTWRKAIAPQTLKTKSEQLLTKHKQSTPTRLSNLNWHKAKPAALAFLLIFSIIMPFLPTEFASAATANLVPNGDITTGWTPSTAGTHYTLVDEGTTANAADHVRTVSGANVDLETEVLELENLSNVVSATSVQVFLHTQIATLLKTADLINVSLIVNGTSVGTTALTPSTTAAWQSVTFNGTWTQSDVDSMRVQFVRSRQGGGSGSSQTDDVRVNSVYVTVTYTPGVNFEQSAYRWFENQDSSTDASLAKLTSPSTMPGSYVLTTDWSPDAQYLSVGSYVTTGDRFIIYKRSGNTFTKLPDPTTMPPGYVRTSAWSPDGQYVSVGSEVPSGEYFIIYKRSGDTFTKLANPSTMPGGNIITSAWSPDGQYLSVGSDTTTADRLTIYKRSGDTFTKLADPSTMPGSNVRTTAWSPDGQYLSVGSGTTTTDRFTVYKRSGDTFTKLANPSTMPGSNVYSAAWSPDGQYLSVGSGTTTTDRFTVYKRSGDTFTKLADPSTMPGDSVLATAWSPDGQYLSAGSDSSAINHLTIYKTNVNANIGNSLGALSTSVTAPTEGTPFRLRMNLHASIGSADPGTSTFKLQYAARGTDNLCDTSFINEAYSDLSQSTGVIRYTNNTNLVDGQSLQISVNDPSHAGHTVTPQSYEESNNFGVNTTIAVDTDGMWDFALVDHSAPANTAYCFRAVYSTGAVLSSYSVIPQITTQSSSLEQAGYRWFENQDGIVNGSVVSTWGGTGNEYAEDVIQTSDGGFVVAGRTDSFTTGGSDQLLIKYDNKGNELWSKTWGGAGTDYAYAVVETNDSGFAVAGFTGSMGNGLGDQTLIKFNSSGVVQWSKTWGGTGNEHAYDLVEIADGSLVTAGFTESYGVNGDQTIVKYSSSGIEQWSKTWGGGQMDYAYGIIETSDGGFAITGFSESYTSAFKDQSLVKFDASGIEQWSKSWGSSGEEYAYDLVEADDGGIVVAGLSGSYGNAVEQTIVKYSSIGAKIWSKRFGAPADEYGHSIAKTSDGGYVVAGYTSSFGAGSYDQLLVKFDGSGIKQWSKSWGAGAGYDQAFGVIETIDGGFALVGQTDAAGAGSDELTFIKTDSTGTIANCGPPYCASSTASEIDVTTAVIDRTVTEGNVTITEANHVVAEVDRTTSSVTSFHAGHITFAKTWGGTSSDNARDIIQTADGGYATAGNTQSYTAGLNDQILVKYDAAGNEQWSKTWGGTGNENAEALIQTTDGGYAVTGRTNGFGGGGFDKLLVKYNSSGIEQWSKTWGAAGGETSTDIIQTTDGGYVIVGSTTSYGAGGVDISMVKFDSSGIEQWSKTWGGTGTEEAKKIVESSDGSLIVVGFTTSFSAGSDDQVIIKFDSSGIEQWSKTWGGTGTDNAFGLAKSSDGGYVVSGRTNSYGAGGHDMSLVKYDGSGIEQWSKTWGGASDDYASDVVQTTDGNIVVAGYTFSHGAGGQDVALVKFDSVGIEQWSRTWGGTDIEQAIALATTQDNGFIIGGETWNFGSGSTDQLLVKYDVGGNVVNCNAICMNIDKTETNHVLSEVDRAVLEGNVTVTEGNVTTTETDRTASSAETLVIAPMPWQNVSIVPGATLSANNSVLSATSRNVSYRIRLQLHVNGKAAAANGSALKLQAAPKVGSCDVNFLGESYSDVTTSSALKYFTGNSTADGVGINSHPSDPTHSGHNNVLQSYESANNITNPYAISVGEDGLWDFALYVDDVILGGSFCLRIVDAGGSPIASYSQVPEIFVSPLQSQQMRHGRFFSAGGETQPFNWR